MYNPTLQEINDLCFSVTNMHVTIIPTSNPHEYQIVVDIPPKTTIKNCFTVTGSDSRDETLKEIQITAAKTTIQLTQHWLAQTSKQIYESLTELGGKTNA